MKLTEAIPLAIFMIYMSQIDTQIPENWESVFITSGLAATTVMALFLMKEKMFDRVFLGINLYLVSGGLAILTHQWWVNRMYDHLHASGVILWITAVGMITTFLSPAGFVGINSPDTNRVKKFSFILLLYCILAFVVSFLGRGSELFSQIVPFTGLFLLQGVLKEKLIKTTFPKTSQPTSG